MNVPQATPTTLLDLVDDEKLTAAIVRDGARATMDGWTSTAIEISRTRHHQISVYHRAFVGTHDLDFRPDQVVGYLARLLALLDTGDERRRLVDIVGFGLKRV
jgi:hypothetical protein